MNKATSDNDLYFNNNIEVVSGYEMGVIYNFRETKIFRINKKISDLLNTHIPCNSNFLLEKLMPFSTKENSQQFISFLTQKEILISEKPTSTFKISDFTILKKILKCNIEVLSKCSFNCPHCYIENKNNGAFISFNKLQEIIIEIVEMGCKVLELTGGDVFLRNDIIDICKFAKDNGIKEIYVLTNGYHLDAKLIGELADLNVKVSLTFYGMSNQTYSKFTKHPNSFDIVIENAKDMVAKGIEINLNYALMSHTYDEVEQFVEFAESINGKHYSIAGVWPSGEAKEKINELKVPIEKWKKINEYTKEQDQLYASEFPKVYSCIPTHLTIHSSGDVSFCLLIDRNLNIFGNIHRNTLREIFQGDLFSNWFETVFISNNIEKCRKCEYKYLCGGECPLYSENVDKDIFVSGEEYKACSKYTLLSNQAIFYKFC
jgi:radical SAM protein with 4Fe4S-binding SPASM domain